MQALSAILVAIRKDFTAHGVVAMRAVVFGMLVWKFVVPLLGVVLPGLHATTIATMSLGLPTTACLGWAITRLHPTRTPMPVIAFLIVVCLTWISPYSRQVANAIADQRFRSYLFTQTLSICAFTLSVLAGGLRPLRHISERRLSS